MGVAMIWVVLYHYQLKGPISLITGHGFTGVDIFMFVSGLGLFMSMYRNNQTSLFYKKRFIRIFPLYLCLGLLYELLKGDFSLKSYIWSYSTLAFWTNGNNNDFGWFIPGIIAIYIVFPFLFRTLFHKGIDKTVLIVLISLLTFFIFYNSIFNSNLISDDHFLLLYRVPVFMLGTLVGYLIAYGKKGSFFLYLSALSLLFVIIHLFSGGNLRLWYMASTFLVPLLIIVFCWLFNHTKSWLYTWLGGVGNASLEIFMIHLFPLMLWPKFMHEISNMNRILVCIVACVVGVVIHKIIAMIKEPLSVKKQ